MKEFPELKSGYLVELEYGDEIFLVMINYNSDDELSFSNGVSFGFIHNINDYGRKVLKVYGRADENRHLNSFDTVSRELLWELKPPKEMTLGEVIEELGYNIKIIE